MRGRLDLQAKVARKYFAAGASELGTQFPDDVRGDQTMYGRTASHGEHFAIKELAFEPGCPFDGEIFGFGQTLLRPRECHISK